MHVFNLRLAQKFRTSANASKNCYDQKKVPSEDPGISMYSQVCLNMGHSRKPMGRRWSKRFGQADMVMEDKRRADIETNAKLEELFLAAAPCFN